MAKQTKTQQVAAAPRAVAIKSDGISTRWYAVIVFAFAFLLYANTLVNDYNMDDELVTRNHRLTSKGISAIPEILTSPYYQDKAGYEYEYRPIVLITFAIEHSFFGESAGVGHFFNTLLYAFLCMFLFYLLQRLFKTYSILLPLLITIVFAAHPIHTEVVASIKNRDEILALFFGLAAVWFSVAYVEDKKVSHLLLVPVMVLLGMLSKTTALTFAMLIPLTLVLLTTASLRSVLIIVTLVLVPVLLFARLYSAWQFIILTIAVYTVTVLLYFYRNSDIAEANFKSIWVIFKKEDSQAVEFEIEASPDSDIDFSFFRNLPVAFLFVAVTVLSFCVSVWGVLHADGLFTGASFLILALLFLFGNAAMRLILITPISLVSIYIMVRFGTLGFPITAALLMAFLVSQALVPNRKFKIVATINYFILAIASALLLNQFMFVAVLFFAGLFNRKLMIVSMLTIAGPVVGVIYKLVTGSELHIKYLNYAVLIVAFLALLYANRKNYVTKGLVILLPIVSAFYFFTHQLDASGNAVLDIKSTYNKVAGVQMPDVAPVNAKRALIYHEYPFKGDEPVTRKLGTSMVILGKYLKLILLPYPMSFYYGYPYIDQTELFTPIPLIVLAIYLALLIAAIYLIRKKVMLAYGMLFYLIAISPYTAVIVPVPGLMGDRFLLIPSLGFAIIVVYGLGLLFKQVFDKKENQISALSTPLKVTLGVLLLCYSGLTMARNTDWKNHLKLFSKDIKVVENSVQAQNLLGTHLLIAASKEPDINKQILLREEAVVHLKRSLQMYPLYLNSSYDIGRAYSMMAEQYKGMNNPTKAFQSFDSAMYYYANTLKIDPGFVTPYYSMGVISQLRGDYPHAIEYFDRYVAKFPLQLDAVSNLSYSYFLAQRYDEAIATNQRFLEKKPGTYEPIVNIGKTYAHINKLDSALIYMEYAYGLNKNNRDLVQFMLNLSNRAGDQRRVMYYGQELRKLSGNRP